jgi:hypothetical protein
MTLKNLRSSPLLNIITLWSTDKGAIPDGWHLCDGTDGTPLIPDAYPLDPADFDWSAFTGLLNVSGGVLSGIVSSAALASVISDETGSGLLVFNNAPTLIAPTLGTAVATKLGIGLVPTYYLDISCSNYSIFRAKNTAASSAAQGAGFTFLSDDNAALASGDRLGYLVFGGSTQAGVTVNSSGISAFASAAWSATSAPSIILFETCAAGSIIRTRRMTIDSEGRVGIGIYDPALSDGIGLNIQGKLLRIGTSKTPASAGATGLTGEICWDTSYIYVCVATNTWKRVAIATW